MKLIYIGPSVEEAGLVPLPEGWPAADHDEADESLAAEKVASGKYRYARPPKPAKGEDEPTHGKAGV